MPKKILKRIVEQHNDYLVQVKGNQKMLFKQLGQLSGLIEPLDSFQEIQKQRGRLEHRQLRLFEPPDNIKELWPGLQRFMQVERTRQVKDRLQHEISYYISSLSKDKADFFAGGIRGHWSIENQLHYPKDVFQHEDCSKIEHKQAAAVHSLFKNIAINLFRAKSIVSVKNAEIIYANKIKKTLKLLKRDFTADHH